MVQKDKNFLVLKISKISKRLKNRTNFNVPKKKKANTTSLSSYQPKIHGPKAFLPTAFFFRIA